MFDQWIAELKQNDRFNTQEPVEPQGDEGATGPGSSFSCVRCYHFRKPYCVYTGRRELADFDLCPMILTGPVGDIGEPLDAAAPEEPAEPRDRGACPICGRGRWWRVMEDTWRCGVCHPPAVADMADEWFIAKDEAER